MAEDWLQKVAPTDLRYLALAAQERLTIPCPVIQAERTEAIEAVREAISSNSIPRLSYREREILKLRFGLDGGFTFTLEEVGHVFKVTRERIRSIQVKALRKLFLRTTLKHVAG